MILKITLTTLTCVLLFLGVKTPNHYYQFLIAAVIVGYLYHRNIFRRSKKPLTWVLLILNFAWFTLLMKLFIGLGVRQPFFWMQYPVWSNFKFSWEPSWLAAWTLDLTFAQTFVLVITLFTSYIRFQPFASFAAFILILFSVPAWLTMDWQFIMPALILSFVSFYIQREVDYGVVLSEE